MYSTIVVGTDGSPTAEAGLAPRHGVRRRQRGDDPHRQRLSVGRRPVKVGTEAEHWYIDTATKVDTDARAVPQATGPQQGPRTSRSTPSRTTPATPSSPSPAEVGADVVVVGNKGMQGAKRFLLGSVPNKVAHNAPCTVVIVKTT